MRELTDMRVGCAMTGSFCTFRQVFEAWRALKAAGAVLTPILSFNAATVDTRFYPAAETRRVFEEITGKKPLAALNEVEPIGPKKLLDAHAGQAGKRHRGHAGDAGGEVPPAQ